MIGHVVKDIEKDEHVRVREGEGGGEEERAKAGEYLKVHSRLNRMLKQIVQRSILLPCQIAQFLQLFLLVIF